MVATACVVGAILVPSAQASTIETSWQESLPAGGWSGWHCGFELLGIPCPGSNAYWDHAAAWYGGSGTVSVCEQAQLSWGGGDPWNLVSNICANNTAIGGSISGYGRMYARMRIKNNSSFTHTINGALYMYAP